MKEKISGVLNDLYPLSLFLEILRKAYINLLLSISKSYLNHLFKYSWEDMSSPLVLVWLFSIYTGSQSERRQSTAYLFLSHPCKLDKHKESYDRVP